MRDLVALMRMGGSHIFGNNDKCSDPGFEYDSATHVARPQARAHYLR